MGEAAAVSDMVWRRGRVLRGEVRRKVLLWEKIERTIEFLVRG